MVSTVVVELKVGGEGLVFDVGVGVGVVVDVMGVVGLGVVLGTFEVDTVVDVDVVVLEVVVLDVLIAVAEVEDMIVVVFGSFRD